MLIEADLIKHEGYSHVVYIDSRGNKTSGIGHLESKHTEVGKVLTTVEVMNNFKNDVNIAIIDAETLVPSLYEHPTDVQRVLINMAFNLGRGRLSKFTDLLQSVSNKNYEKAASDMVASDWYKQTRQRAKTLVNMMRSKHGVL